MYKQILKPALYGLLGAIPIFALLLYFDLLMRIERLEMIFDSEPRSICEIQMARPSNEID